MFPTPSFRTRILLLVLIVAVAPLGLLGLWLTGAAARSGEELLRSRLHEALDAAMAQIGEAWIRERSELWSMMEDETVQRGLRGAAAASLPPALLERFGRLGPAVQRAVIRDGNGRAAWTLEQPAPGGRPPEPGAGGLVTLELGIFERTSGRRLGTLEASLETGALLGGPGAISAAAGTVLGALDPYTGASLLPLPFDAALLSADRFVWGGDDWLTARARLVEPPLELVAAAPLSPFTTPFEAAARRGTWLLVAVAVAAFALAGVLTRRMTRSLGTLAQAADAVSRGELERKVEEGGADEVGRVARAFNTMTESLRRTLRELADREALAAVGEFAAALAHEVRNPLTSIRLDLQWVEESLDEGSPQRQAQGRALAEIARLDETVADALTVARSGHIRARRLDLGELLESAIHAAEPAFAARNAHLRRPAPNAASIQVHGEAGSLQRVFLNLLLNAAQALELGGSAEVAVRTDDGVAAVTIRDTGGGIAPENLERVFEPFFSTRPGGTGLGLAVARRIIAAHGGAIRIDSVPDAGTSVEVRLPLHPDRPVEKL